MPTKDKEFNKKLKNCKSLQDYTDLADEYNLNKEGWSVEYSERLLRKTVKKDDNLSKFF